MRETGRFERGNADDAVTRIYKMCLVDGRSGASCQSLGRQADQTSRDKRSGNKKKKDEVGRRRRCREQNLFNESEGLGIETKGSFCRRNKSGGCSPPPPPLFPRRDARTKDSLNHDTSENVSLPRKLRCRRFRTHPAALDIIAVNYWPIDEQPAERCRRYYIAGTCDY